MTHVPHATRSRTPLDDARGMFDLPASFAQGGAEAGMRALGDLRFGTLGAGRERGK